MSARLKFVVFWLLCAAYEVLWIPARSFDLLAYRDVEKAKKR